MNVQPHSAIPSWYGYVYQGQLEIVNLDKNYNNLTKNDKKIIRT